MTFKEGWELIKKMHTKYDPTDNISLEVRASRGWGEKDRLEWSLYDSSLPNDKKIFNGESLESVISQYKFHLENIGQIGRTGASENIAAVQI